MTTLSPIEARRRMLSDDDTAGSETDQLLALRRMGEADRWQMLQDMSDCEVRRVVALMREDDEFVESLLEEDDATCLSILQKLSDEDRWRILFAIPDDDIVRLFGSD
jgi:Mg/Co/Ni transporter MgtE